MSNCGKNGLGYAESPRREAAKTKHDASASLVDRRALGRAATGAVASALYLGLPAPADGAVITNADLGLGGFTVSTSGSGDFSWDVDGDGQVDITNADNLGSTGFGNGDGLNMARLSYGGGYGFLFGALVASNGSFYNGQIENLAVGELVGPSQGFGTGNLFNGGSAQFVSSYYNPVGGGFIGFRFASMNAGGYSSSSYGLDPNQVHYGWAEVEFDSNNSTFTVLRWAYEDVTDTAIAVPEPSTQAMVALGLLALGAPAQRRWRRKRAATAAA